MNAPLLIEVKKQDEGQRIDRWLKKHLPHISYIMAQKLFRKGAIKIDDKKAKASDRLRAGQKIRVPEVKPAGKERPKPTVNREDAEKLILNHIIYEDEKLIAINKPPGLAAQGGSKILNSVDSLLRALGDGKDYKLVHRIDKDTSGLMIVAKGRENAIYLTTLFKERRIKKVYWTIVVGVPHLDEGKISLPLAAKKSNGKIEKAIVDEKNGQKAVTYYRVMEKAAKQLAWLEVYPETGRMHQIRVHMQAVGTPVLGDGKYGGKAAFISGLSNKMHLHARQITIPGYSKEMGVRCQVSGVGKKESRHPAPETRNPKSGDLVLTADLPEHIRNTFEMFNFQF